MPPIAPDLADVLAARRHVLRHLQRTPLIRSPGLSALLGAHVWVKHENHLPTGAFKVRGGVHLSEGLGPEERRAGLYTASTGNHGQSIAFGGQATGTPVTIAVPRGANPVKVASMEALGAKVVEHGADYDEAREWIEARAKEEGARFVGPADMELIAGVATYALEIFEDLPDPDAILVPVGAGSGACGCCVVAHAVRPATAVIAVQSAQAPTQERSWRAGHAVEAPMQTRAEGLATRVAHDLPHGILRDARMGLDDFVLVDDAEMEEAVRLHLTHTRNLAEHAGAASLAGALAIRERLAGQKVVLVLSGGNLAPADLRRIVADGAP